jgi:hypothetical protein
MHAQTHKCRKTSTHTHRDRHEHARIRMHGATRPETHRDSEHGVWQFRRAKRQARRSARRAHSRGAARAGRHAARPVQCRRPGSTSSCVRRAARQGKERDKRPARSGAVGGWWPWRRARAQMAATLPVADSVNVLRIRASNRWGGGVLWSRRRVSCHDDVDSRDVFVSHD